MGTTHDIPVINAEAAWLPFTGNRAFKDNPAQRTLVSAKGAYYQNAAGQTLFDCLSGLWCTPLGHGHPAIVETLKRQAETLDYGTGFQFSNPQTLRLAERIAERAPAGLDHVFFTNSGSESIDTALKIAIGYHRLRGEATRFRMIGRERGYHGVGFGGVSVGGMVANRKMFAPLMLNGVDHLPHTHNLSEMAFSRGQPKWGAHLADELEKLVALHDASSIAAVIVEPMAGSTGVLAPPEGYLQRLRDICTRHGILLIFDEVICGFGRLGDWFAASRFGVTPDMICFAKTITNGVVPLGGVIVRPEIYQAFMTGPAHAVEFMHGYTYSGHPLAAAVGNTVLDLIDSEGHLQHARALEPVLENAVHALRDESSITDIRNMGLAAAVDLAPIPGQPGLRGYRVFEAGLQKGHLFRVTGDTVAMGPPFIAQPAEIETMTACLRDLIRSVPNH
ncbi:aminotransferase class III-fold pyridoxal phosphate-dependent enzyme [Amantichitinum ursilacus]|uniref:Omega-amino acid--pyruvate aminotransferase n=1 Tax=Amantichitinum ursilacus TaxID=857265 RepID=A0A0N0XL98_9NEIS|nr:aminotransferase class III-fold pyridoxal phosphate-dependent enzyme [Amantichitinum ursilacus]KPC53895.1 Omega-amino acid--pyruvate aminotransferase [Amantichitinum ursilacus]